MRVARCHKGTGDARLQTGGEGQASVAPCQDMRLTLYYAHCSCCQEAKRGRGMERGTWIRLWLLWCSRPDLPISANGAKGRGRREAELREQPVSSLSLFYLWSRCGVYVSGVGVLDQR